MDAAVQSCRVQSEDVKNESKGLQETGLPAIYYIYYYVINGDIRVGFFSGKNYFFLSGGKNWKYPEKSGRNGNFRQKIRAHCTKL